MTKYGEVQQHYGRIKNLVGGSFRDSQSGEMLPVTNPATGQTIAEVPLSTKQEVAEAVAAAKKAFLAWRETPPMRRVQHLFRLKDLLEAHLEELARIVTQEEGKALEEARGEVRRAIETTEMACGIPTLMAGRNLEDVAPGIDEHEVRQPLGVFCQIAPFNFPAMIPFWFLPYAVACGNTYVVKPSEQVPLTQSRIATLIQEAGFPPGVVNMVNGAKDVVDALLEHPDIRGASFVGSTPVARYVYSKATAQGKRAQCHAGAKNFLVVMPDADMRGTIDALISSIFGSAGERCLAGSVVMPIGLAYEPVKAELMGAARSLRVGYGLDPATQMGPVISRRHLERVHHYIEQGVQEGARLLLDGRDIRVPGFEEGYFVGPTVFDEVRPDMAIAKEEIFGPVACLMPARDLEEAIGVIEASRYGNAASIFTTNGGHAREFQHRVTCGNIGINVGIPAPVAPFPFSGMRESFFGDLHGQGLDSINFFTERKIVITRWAGKEYQPFRAKA
ncbi:MAG: CoA-acylating methylmalonate-semialdehyde dehydrogenase [Chloroflexi bacterium]|nr:CoA-acylating methylmalonate-semialdehyde dehydrogenase [Chloroflexota bacterium]